MRFTIPAINNDYYDEDYLRVFGFKSLGKNIRVHRSVVFMKPANISIADDVTIMPYCVFGTGKTDDIYQSRFAHFTPDDLDRKRQIAQYVGKMSGRTGMIPFPLNDMPFER